MKTSFFAAVSLALIAGVPLSASAKPAEALQREGMLASGRHDGGQIVLAAAGKARGDDGRSNSDGRQTDNGNQGSSSGRSDDGRTNNSGSGQSRGDDGRSNSGGGSQGGSFGWLAGRDDRYGHYNGGGHDDGHGGGGHGGGGHGGGHGGGGHGDHDDDHDGSPCKPHH